jgi:hypothetical protein
MPYLVGLAHLLAPVRMVSGVVGAIRKDARTATDVFLTTTPTCCAQKLNRWFSVIS